MERGSLTARHTVIPRHQWGGGGSVVLFLSSTCRSAFLRVGEEPLSRGVVLLTGLAPLFRASLEVARWGPPPPPPDPLPTGLPLLLAAPPLLFCALGVGRRGSGLLLLLRGWRTSSAAGCCWEEVGGGWEPAGMALTGSRRGPWLSLTSG